MSDKYENLGEYRSMDDDIKTLAREIRNMERLMGQSLVTLLEPVQDIAEDKKEEDTASRRYTQYSTPDGKCFLPASKTQPLLPSGLYSIFNTQQGIVFNKEEFLTDDLIVLPESKSEFIINEIKKFWGLKAKYEAYGLIHKRGFLLHGTPGGGKTSTVALVTKNMLDDNGLVFVCQNIKLLEEAIKSVREIEKERKVTVILEDIDELINLGQEHHLLNLLDGASQIDNVIYIATTNYPENLSPRLINRPSRFDHIVEIGTPNEESRKLYLTKKAGNHIYTKDGVDYDLAKMTEKFTFAHLRDLIASLYCLELPLHETLERLQKMQHEKPDSSRYGKKMGISLSSDERY